MAEALRAMGAPEEVVARALKARGAGPDEVAADEAFAVDPDNWASWGFFLSVQTEWVYGGLGLDLRRLKLDMPGIEARLRLCGEGRRAFSPRIRRCMADLFVIEREVIDTDCRRALNRQKRR